MTLQPDSSGQLESKSPPETMVSTPPKVFFKLFPSGEMVGIPDNMFLYSVFLRDYKKLYKVPDGEDLIIPIQPFLGQCVQRQHLEIVYEFFNSYHRHVYGPDSSAKNVPSNGDVSSGGTTSASGAVAAMPTPEMTVSPAVFDDIDIKSRAKWSKFSDWAHGWFSALDKDLLIEVANIANYLNATPFTEHYVNFLAVKITLTAPESLNVMADFFNEEFDAEWKSRYNKWLQEKKKAEEQQKKKDAEDAKRLAEEEEKRKKQEEEEEEARRKLEQENGNGDY